MYSALEEHGGSVWDVHLELDLFSLYLCAMSSCLYTRSWFCYGSTMYYSNFFICVPGSDHGGFRNPMGSAGLGLSESLDRLDNFNGNYSAELRTVTRRKNKDRYFDDAVDANNTSLVYPVML